MSSSSLTLLATLDTPAPISVLSFGKDPSILLAGADDGSVRIYRLPETKVIKAIRGLPADVASIASFMPKAKTALAENDLGHVWIASGKDALLFDLDSDAMILTASSMIKTFALGEEEDDAVNELAVSTNGSLLAFGVDSGAVGTVDIQSGRIIKMKSAHTSICGSVKFIPDRPSELVSGGYDSSLLHFDHQQRTVLSRHILAAPPPTELGSGISLSPPFVLCTAVSSAGLVAAGTADGRVWLGTGGEKGGSRVSKKKKSRKWEGLRAEEAVEERVAEGPVVAIAFVAPDTFVACSLLGVLTYLQLQRDEDGTLRLGKQWAQVVQGLAKVNTLAVCDKHLVVGGFTEGGRGAALIYLL